ncbi:hypothetical protein ANN_21512 [Periplaneta americana]|uniref:Uncharacterized protein n=1 Tax=Periplaneta americana TaxID=6978 RepID=A0ABQ8SFV0_PERAM|nr:hypothetical protein ANN_21512 [Periplaneta americana]
MKKNEEEEKRKNDFGKKNEEKQEEEDRGGEAPDACEVLSVKKFLNEQGIAPIEIDRQLCQVYGPNIMSKQMVRCSTRSSVMMVGLPLRSSSCTLWRPAENCLQQRRTICLLITWHR